MKNRSAKKKEISLVNLLSWGRGQEQRRGDGGGASVWRALGIERRQRGWKHQHFGLHEGQIGQTGDHFSRLFAQVFVFPGFPVQTGSDKRAAGAIKHRQQKSAKTNIVILLSR